MTSTPDDYFAPPVVPLPPPPPPAEAYHLPPPPPPPPDFDNPYARPAAALAWLRPKKERTYRVSGRLEGPAIAAAVLGFVAFWLFIALMAKVLSAAPVLLYTMPAFSFAAVAAIYKGSGVVRGFAMGWIAATMSSALLLFWAFLNFYSTF